MGVVPRLERRRFSGYSNRKGARGEGRGAGQTSRRVGASTLT